MRAAATSRRPICRLIATRREAERKLRAPTRASVGLGARAAGRRVGDQADPVSARSLAARQVEHVAEQPADRRAQDMQDLESAGVPFAMRAFTIC